MAQRDSETASENTPKKLKDTRRSPERFFRNRRFCFAMTSLGFPSASKDVYYEQEAPREFRGTVTSEGAKALIYKLKSKHLEVVISEFGATVVNVKYRGEELTLNHGTLEELERGDAYYGATVGRYANRIRRGRYVLDGKVMTLPTNDNGTHWLHGGPRGWSHRIWKGAIKEGPVIELVLDDEDPAFPGAGVRATTRYRVEKENLEMTWDVVHLDGETEPTIVNVTNHIYWNLTGDLFQKVHDHLLWMPYGKRYVVTDDGGIPTGNLRPIKEHGKLDFWSAPRWIGDVDNGLDHCFIHEPDANPDPYADPGATMPMRSLKASLVCQSHKLRMDLHSDHPALQVYMANFLPDDKDAVPHDRHRAVCLEPQHCPDSPNHDNFPPGFILRPGSSYHHAARFSFISLRQPFGKKECPACGHTPGLQEPFYSSMMARNLQRQQDALRLGLLPKNLHPDSSSSDGFTIPDSASFPTPSLPPVTYID